MDISLLQNLQSLIRQAQSAQGRPAQAGESVEAEVKDIRLVTREQQINLLQQLQKNVATLANKMESGALHTSSYASTQPNNPPNQPATPDATSLQQRILLLQQVIKENAPLYLLKLLVGQKSHVLLSPGQLEPGSRLTLQNTEAGLVSQTTKPQKAPIEATKETLRQPLIDNLRLHLPAAEKSNQSLNLLDKLIGVLLKLPPQQSQAFFNRVQIQTLNNLVRNILTLQSTTNTEAQLATQVKTAVANSGNFLESKVFQTLKPFVTNLQRQALANPAVNPSPVSAPVSAHTSPSSGQTPLAHTRSLTANPLPVTNTTSTGLNQNIARGAAANPQSVNSANNLPPNLHNTSPKTESGVQEALKELQVDNKTLLLNILQSLQAPPASSPMQTTRRALDPGFLALLRNFGLRLPGQKSEVNAQHIQNETRNLAQNVLSRIQSLQIQNLISRSAEGGNNTQVEIHMRIQDQIYPILLYFQERIIKIKEDEKEKEKKKDKRKFKRQWKVFMEFELEDCGWFASELSLADEKLNTRFWAKAQRTRERLLNKLKDLKLNMQAAGLEVEEIQVLPGDIPRARKQFEQHLVDIQT